MLLHVPEPMRVKHRLLKKRIRRQAVRLVLSLCRLWRKRFKTRLLCVHRLEVTMSKMPRKRDGRSVWRESSRRSKRKRRVKKRRKMPNWSSLRQKKIN